MGDGTIQGSTKSALGQRPGEKVVHTYTGSIGHGYSIHTYLSGFDAYWVDPLVEMDSAAATRPYHVNVYQTNISNGGQVYFSVYQGYTAGDGGSQLTGGTVKVNSLLLGDR